MIRKMTENDIDQVVEIENQCFSDPWSYQGFIDTILNPQALCLVYVEEPTEKVLGYAFIYKALDEGEIVNVAVSQQGRRQGIGFTLVENLIQNGLAMGIEQFYLEVRISNRSAKQLYEKLGFKQIGIRKGMYERPVEDALIMMWSKM